MKNPLNYFRSIEETNLRLPSRGYLKIEHSGLENLIGLLATGFVATITSPIWAPYLLCSLGKEGYNKIRRDSCSEE